MKHNATHKLLALFSLALLISSFTLYGVRDTTNVQPVDVKNDNFPQPNGFVNDYEGILSNHQEKNLMKMIEEQNAKHKTEIYVVTVKSIEPYRSIDDYSMVLANYWGINHKDKTNAILFVLGKNFKKVKICLGSDMTFKIDGNELKKANDKMAPLFEKGDYYNCLKNGIEIIAGGLSK
ncbi:MAG: TPM domain-containing protein [Crocinitomicaceae bacterium]|jgi:uncharacterized protein|nr:TPM domain-containing protein [Crocinitomicaceae bacterium]